MTTSAALKLSSSAIADSAIPVKTVVIGAGVVGLAVARAIAIAYNGASGDGDDNEILIVDRASRIGSETSSRNSEVVHAGLYYPSNSLKAKSCVRGKQLLYQYCEQRDIDYRRTGKLVVATNPEQLHTELPKLRQNAINNGVNDTKLLNPDDVQYMEPNLRTTCGALYSPSTGIVDTHNFMLNLLTDFESYSGNTLALRTEVTDAAMIVDNGGRNSKILLQCSSGGSDGEDNENDVDESGGMWLACEQVINCAGLWSDRIATTIHSNSTNTKNYSPPKQYLAKGNYFKLQGCKSPFKHLIYPVPEAGGLGVHATIDINQQTKFGPDVEWLPPNTNPDDVDWMVDPNRASSFYDAIRRYWPDLPDGTLVPDYSGARPKLSHPSLLLVGGKESGTTTTNNNKLPFQDFQIVGPRVHGVPGLIHLFGIESPGLTSSMAIAEYVTELLQQQDD